jgi:hypothetical protein
MGAGRSLTLRFASFSSRRPYLASQCDNLKDAERWRRQIIREISKKVADIQNGALSSLLSCFHCWC